MNLNVIILAAGKGSRMKSLAKNYSKVAFPILGIPVVEYVLNAVEKVNPKEIITVIGFGGKTTEKIVSKRSKCVWQKEPKGTGDAVKHCIKYIKKSPNDLTLVVCGDAPLITSETIQDLIDFHIKYKNDQTLLSAVVSNPTGYGRIVRDEFHNLVKVVEETDCNCNEKKIKEVNTGVVIFSNPALLSGLKQLTNKNAKKEYYLTQLISIFLANKDKVGVKIIKNPEEMDGINDRYQLSLARKKLQLRINQEHMLNGVSIMDIYSVAVGPYVTIEPDTQIEPNTIIMGKTQIGCNCIIGANSYIIDSTIEDNTVIEPFTYIKNNKKIK